MWDLNRSSRNADYYHDCCPNYDYRTSTPTNDDDNVTPTPTNHGSTSELLSTHQRRQLLRARRTLPYLRSRSDGQSW